MNNNYQIGGIVMEPKLVTLDAIKLVGYELITSTNKNENMNEIPAFWQSYLSDGRSKKLHEAGIEKSHNEYGACFPEDPETGGFLYVIGVEVKDGADVSNDFKTYELPPATYAVFTSPPSNAEGFSDSIQGTWAYIMDEWFPSSGYEYAPGCVDFEFYDCEIMMKDEVTCDIYIPVVKK